MNILIIGNIASVGRNFKKGLMNRGHKVYLVCDQNLVLDNDLIDCSLRTFLKTHKSISKDAFDIIHVNAPAHKKYIICRYFHKAKIIAHWHGTDIRRIFYPLWYPMRLEQGFVRFVYDLTIGFLGRMKFLQRADFHLYSTIDLAFRFKDIPDDRKMRMINPIDTDIFKPMLDYRKYDKIIFGRKAFSFGSKLIPHKDVPKLLNQYRRAECYPAEGLSPYLISVSALECAACGLSVKHHPYMNRAWILQNASIQSQTDKLLKIYEKVFDDTVFVDDHTTFLHMMKEDD